MNPHAGGCPGAFPHLKTQRSVEPGKLCWKTDRGAKAGTSCADWCLLKQYAKENPGGHLDNCPRNICKTQGSKKETGRCWQEFTKSASCTEGWRKARSYTFYQTVVGEHGPRQVALLANRKTSNRGSLPRHLIRRTQTRPPTVRSPYAAVRRAASAAHGVAFSCRTGSPIPCARYSTAQPRPIYDCPYNVMIIVDG